MTDKMYNGWNNGRDTGNGVGGRPVDYQTDRLKDKETAIEHRPDCSDFEPKRWPHDRGDCQTDGHYLCAGCKHIAPFGEMEESDNSMRYYPKEEKVAIELEKMREIIEELDSDFERFPLPIEFDAREELKQLSLRSQRIREIAKRYFCPISYVVAIIINQ